MTDETLKYALAWADGKRLDGKGKTDPEPYAGILAHVYRRAIQDLAEAKKGTNILCEERDEALTKWHAHQKNVPCAGCKGGHDTFWGTVVSSPQWAKWYKSRPNFDVDECQECGHISQVHFQAFLKFVGQKKKAKRKGK